ncbi:hypothetical protein emb_1c0499 [Coriobacteriaceae bacterium EMTCatB1]|nr:hypothetical protein emb_1c0499 [Coriobacteriaceae bacterium EMTCatB1]
MRVVSAGLGSVAAAVKSLSKRLALLISAAMVRGSHLLQESAGALRRHRAGRSLPGQRDDHLVDRVCKGKCRRRSQDERHRARSGVGLIAAVSDCARRSDDAVRARRRALRPRAEATSGALAVARTVSGCYPDTMH